MSMKERIASLVSYDPKTGVFALAPRGPELFKKGRYSQLAGASRWNKRWAGKRTMTTLDTSGYCQGKLLGKPYLAHRVAFLVMTGDWPSGHVDHINGNRADNRWENLRQVTRFENQKNQKLYKNNKSGVMGVYFQRASEKWVARISHKGTEKYLGIFSDFEEAVAVRRAAEIKYEYHDNHGRVD